MTTAPSSPQPIKAGLVLIDAATAGTRLRDAIQAVQPPPPAPDAGQLERDLAPQARLSRCREVPWSFDFGVRGPLTTPDTGAGTGAPPPASFIGGSLRLHF